MNDKDRIRALEQEIARDRDMCVDLLRDTSLRASAAERKAQRLERENFILREELAELRESGSNCLTFKGSKAVDKWAKANK